MNYRKAAAVVMAMEGLSLQVYKDAVDVKTYCYGQTQPFDKEHGDFFNKTSCDLGLYLTIDSIVSHLSSSLKYWENYNDNQQAALVSFVYNIGTTKFDKSTLLRRLNKGDLSAFSTEAKKWIFAGGKKVKGLVKRRQSEINLWEKLPKLPKG